PQPPAPDRAREARALAATRRRLFVVSSALGLAYPALLWLGGIAQAVWTWLLGAGLPTWWALVVLLALYGVAESLALLPLGYYGGYVVAHRYSLSRQRLPSWFADWAKGMALGLALAVVVGLIFFWLLEYTRPGWWWLYGLVLSAGFAFLSYVAPYLLVPLFFRMRPLDDQRLLERLRALLDKAGVQVQQVCSIDFSRKTVEANAAVIGLGPSRRIVIADTLVESFTLPEVESVVAHELGHHVHRDVLRMVLVEAVVVTLGLGLAHWLGLPLLEPVVGLQLERLPAALPLLALAAQVYFLALMPATNALSRTMEAAADRFALALTGDGAAFASAMRRLASQNLAEEQPPRWAEWLLYTHPPIARRIAMAEAWGRE
ncbi:MAG: M48 family metalloprotease, partial [Chloroflexi bacterium]|nr:M48 family metalloprotease [Chloroflexota bacterium]